MKINFIKLSLAIVASALISFGFYSSAQEGNKTLLATCSMVVFSLVLGLALGTRAAAPRVALVTRAVSTVFFLFALLANACFALALFSPTFYVVGCGLALCTYLLVIYSLQHEKA
ncbi:hypothetical protein [Parasediminibacterium sp. JCM 36343]|uniref:hypothetical protein n=1 Tax=Parasediminibacterium sp. JCM 36343 TaxID=3374279 RepID=UPI00397E7382